MKQYYKLFLFFLLFGCSRQQPNKIFIGIDLSNSNKTSLENKIHPVIESLYEYHPNSDLIIYAFGDNIYKVFDGKIPTKPRELKQDIISIITSNVKFSFKDGTKLIKLVEVIDSSKFSEIFIITDGYFELTTEKELSDSQNLIQNNKFISNIYIYGCSVQNRDKIYKVFNNHKINFNEL